MCTCTTGGACRRPWQGPKKLKIPEDSSPKVKVRSQNPPLRDHHWLTYSTMLEIHYDLACAHPCASTMALKRRPRSVCFRRPRSLKYAPLRASRWFQRVLLQPLRPPSAERSSPLACSPHPWWPVAFSKSLTTSRIGKRSGNTNPPANQREAFNCRDFRGDSAPESWPDEVKNKAD